MTFRRSLYLFLTVLTIASCLTLFINSRRPAEGGLFFRRQQHHRQLAMFDPRTVLPKNEFVTQNEEHIAPSKITMNNEIAVLSDAAADNNNIIIHAAQLATLRTYSMAEAAAIKCSKPVTMYDSAPPHENPRYNCAYNQPFLTEAYTCGTIQIPYDSDPWVWECRSKSRLLDRIMEHHLKDSVFLSIDIGAGNGDWAIALGSFAPKSLYAVVEASPFTYQGMYQNLATNAGLIERVYAYNVEAGSPEAFAEYDGNTPLFDNVSGAWVGPIACVSSGPNIYLTDKCPASKAPVPILNIDHIMTDFVSISSKNEGGRAALFYLKMNLEGGDYQALLGARTLFSSTETRPCYVYIKLQGDNPSHEEAFHLLRNDYGYTNFADLDSGEKASYPPQGRFRPNEGNYEFGLPPAEEKACVERVQQESTYELR